MLLHLGIVKSEQALRLFTRQRQGHNYLSNIFEDNDLYLSDNLKKKSSTNNNQMTLSAQAEQSI